MDKIYESLTLENCADFGLRPLSSRYVYAGCDDRVLVFWCVIPGGFNASFYWRRSADVWQPLGDALQLQWWGRRSFTAAELGRMLQGCAMLSRQAMPEPVPVRKIDDRRAI